MQRIDLKPSRASDLARSVLYPAERPDNRLLMWIDQDSASDVVEIDRLADILGDEGWSVLHTRVAPGVEAAAIVAALATAVTHGNSASSAQLRVVAVAETTSVPAACAAVLASHRRSDMPRIDGLVTVDATPGTATPHFQSLAEVADLTTLTAARRQSREARKASLAYHRQLQSLGRDTHFVVLDDSGRSLASRAANPRDPFGREVRWLLEPVNSRTM